MHLNLKVSSDRNNAYEVLFYAFLSVLPDTQMETPWRQIIFSHPVPVCSSVFFVINS
jgi:hypothetical protein